MIKSNLAELETDQEEALEKWTTARAEVLAIPKNKEMIAGQIEQLTKADAKSVYAILSDYEKCPSDTCPMRVANRESPKSDAAKDHHLATLREQLADLERQAPARQLASDKARIAYANAAKLAKAERERLSTEVAGIDRRTGLWQSYKKDAESYQNARKKIGDLDIAIGKLDKKIEKSNKDQEAVRDNIRKLITRLSSCYDSILKQVFDDTASGSVVVDGKGLRPVPDNRLAPNGAALSIMTTVLAFDLSSVAASIAGVGQHPRLLLHDSPREGDMEEPLFQQLFQIARTLEDLFGEDKSSFQYIVTTTTPPPAELSDEQGPYVRLTLDARVEADHLLGTTF